MNKKETNLRACNLEKSDFRIVERTSVLKSGWFLPLVHHWVKLLFFSLFELQDFYNCNIYFQFLILLCNLYKLLQVFLLAVHLKFSFMAYG